MIELSINKFPTLSHYRNAIGPLIAIWMIYTDGSVLQKSKSPLLLLLNGGLGMCVRLWIFGRRVNDTIGKASQKSRQRREFLQLRLHPMEH